MLCIKLWTLSVINLSRRWEKQAVSTACTLAFHQECQQGHFITHHKGGTATKQWKWEAILSLEFRGRMGLSAL